MLLLISNSLNKTIQHAFLACFIEVDREFVAVDARDVAVAEFQVEDPVADREPR